MKIIRPIPIDDSILTSSSIAEPDATVGEVAHVNGQTYNEGDQVILVSTHRKYQVVANSTTDSPDAGVIADPPTWVDIGPTNKYAMFSDKEPQSSTANGNITIVLTPGQIAGGIAAFGVSASNINITAVSAADGEVYNKDLGMIDTSGIFDFTTYFFNDIVLIDRFWQTDIPLYNDLTITITFTDSALSVKNLVIGKVIRNIGRTNLDGTTVVLKDYSEYEYDEFGNYKGRIAGQVRDEGDYQVTVDRAMFNSIVRTFRSITGTPCVYIGSENAGDQPLTVFGIHSSFGPDLNVSVFFYSFKVQGIA